MASKSKVYFFYDKVVMTVRNKNKIKKLVEQIFLSEGRPLNRLNYIFCTDKMLLDINRRYLNHDYYTDIISFDLSDQPNQTIGEVYISIDRVKDNALKLKTPFDHELYRVIFHGALHLCGYCDRTKKEKREMRQREDFYLNVKSV